MRNSKGLALIKPRTLIVESFNLSRNEHLETSADKISALSPRAHADVGCHIIIY